MKTKERRIKKVMVSYTEAEFSAVESSAPNHVPLASWVRIASLGPGWNSKMATSPRSHSRAKGPLIIAATNARIIAQLQALTDRLDLSRNWTSDEKAAVVKEVENMTSTIVAAQSVKEDETENP